MTQADYTYDPQPAPQPFGELVSQQRDAESSFYQFDALGSRRALTDGSEVVTDEAAYEAFGKTAAASGTTANPFQWVGQVGYYADEERVYHGRITRTWQPAEDQNQRLALLLMLASTRLSVDKLIGYGRNYLHCPMMLLRLGLSWNLNCEESKNGYD